MPAALSTAVSVSTRRTIAPPKASMNGAGISTSGDAKTEAGSGTGWSSSKIVGLASPLVKTPKMAEPLVKMSGFPESPRALVITATASRSLAKLSGVPSTCPMLAVLTMASTWAAGAARLTGSAKSPKTGIKPADRSFAAAESDRDKARISCRCCDSFRGDGGPDKSGRARDKDLHGATKPEGAWYVHSALPDFASTALNQRSMHVVLSLIAVASAPLHAGARPRSRNGKYPAILAPNCVSGRPRIQTAIHPVPIRIICIFTREASILTIMRPHVPSNGRPTQSVVIATPIRC
jgi:hypothetical protein